MELNGVEKCPLCGMNSEALTNKTTKLIESKWAWHAVIYHSKFETLSLICGGTLLQSKAVITTGSSIFIF